MFLPGKFADLIIIIMAENKDGIAIDLGTTHARLSYLLPMQETTNMIADEEVSKSIRYLVLICIGIEVAAFFFVRVMYTYHYNCFLMVT